MGVKSFIKKSVAFVSALAMACSMVVMPAGASYAEEGTPITPSNEPQVYKTAELQSDGTYKITLESFVTGEVDVSTEWSTTPCDIVLVLDQSGSMAGDMSSEITYTAINSQGYSYSTINDGTYYYKDGDQYYRVYADRTSRINNTRYYYLYYRKNGTTYYLSGTDVVSNRPYNVTNNSTIIWTGVLYEGKTTTRLEALQNAANSFINGVSESATTTGADHRIAVVGFAGDNNTYTGQGRYMNTELFIGSNQYNYGGYGSDSGSNQTSAASTQYGNALQSIKTQKDVLEESINSLAANGGTHPQYGLEMANGIFDAYKDDSTYTKDDGTIGTRDKIIVVFTDGGPGGTTNNPFNDNVANSAIKQASTSKDKNGCNAKIYSVGIFSGADASADPTSSSTSKSNKFMHFISSNYPNAQSMSDTGERDPKGAYYKSASNVKDLNNIFKEIAQDTVGGSASVTLGKDAISKDIISENFDLPDGITESNVKDYVDVSTVAYEGLGKWSATKVPIDDRSTELSDSEKATISLDKENKTFNVSNFDFSGNYVGDGTLSNGEPTATGKKLVIEITGVTAKHSGEDMNTNDSASGIYTGTTLVKAYNEPVVSIPDKSYVLDYGKTVSTNAVADHNLKAVTKLNTAKPAPSDIPDATTMQGTYGTFDISSLKTDGGLKYTPGKINWDGFDTAYVFGQVNGSTKYLWGAVNFIPASSVYYEDDFGYETNDKSDVAIVWGTDENGKSLWNKEGTSTGGQQSSENKLYGNDSLYAEEKGYTNGSAHVSDKEGATAKFTFTGTGVDIYSRTNKDFAGVIFARLVSDTDTSFKAQNILVDNTSESGDYYQVPTLAFEDLPYGKYTVTLTVVANDKDGRSTYYLDGIRVYNPLGKVSNDSVAGKAYKEAGESNAVYKKVRDNLVTSGFGSITYEENGETVEQQGAVYIDKITDSTSHETYDETVFDKYGPKNEVYLDNGQAVAFNISGYTSNNNVFIGLKSLTGEEITVNVTNGDDSLTPITIKSTADLYYPIKPTSSGNVVIINKGNAKLSITKVRVTEKEPTTVSNASYSLMSTRALASYVDTVYTLPVVEDKTDDDTILDKDDVEIENPSDDNQNNQEEKPTSIWEQILNSIKDWFGNR